MYDDDEFGDSLGLYVQLWISGGWEYGQGVALFGLFFFFFFSFFLSYGIPYVVAHALLTATDIDSIHCLLTACYLIFVSSSASSLPSLGNEPAKSIVIDYSLSISGKEVVGTGTITTPNLTQLDDINE